MSSPNTKIKYAMYLRKSTDSEDRQIQSIEDQRKELERFAKQFNVLITGVYQENKSAKAPGRPEFNRMMDDVRKGKLDGILCWKINRLARNPVDGGEIQWLLQQGIIKSILTPAREYRSEDNVMMMSVELGMANQFILDLSKDVKRGMVSKAEKGWRPGLAPLGYKNDKYQEKGKKEVLVDEAKFPLVRKLWDYMLTGNYTIPRLTEIASEEWGLRTTFHKKESKLYIGNLYKIFTNPFYYGEYDFAGKTYQGKHKAMITPEEYDRVQKILGKDGKPRPKYKKLPFNGLIHCGECGCSITADEKIKYIKSEKTLKSYIYHKCTKRKRGVKCSQKPIGGSELEKQIYSVLDSITIPESFLEFALQELNKENDNEAKNRTQIIKNLQKSLNDSQQRIDNLIKLYISPSNAKRELLSDEEFKEQKTSLIKEKNNILSELKKAEERTNEWMDLTIKTFELAVYAKSRFATGDYETKTGILRALGSNFVLKDQQLTITLANQYQLIEKSLKQIVSENPMFELTDFSLNKTKTAYFEAVSDILSG